VLVCGHEQQWGARVSMKSQLGQGRVGGLVVGVAGLGRGSPRDSHWCSRVVMRECKGWCVAGAEP